MTSMFCVDKTSFLPGIRHLCLVLSQNHYYVHATSHCQKWISGVRKIYTVLYSKNISPLTCTIEEQCLCADITVRCKGMQLTEHNLWQQALVLHRHTTPVCVCWTGIVFSISVTQYCTLASAHLHAVKANSWHAHNTHDNLRTDNWVYTVIHVMGNNHKLCQYLIIMLLYNL